MKPSDNDGSIPVNDEQEPQDDAKREGIALVVIKGGAAEILEHEPACIRIIDLDNIAAGDPPVELPAGIGFEELCKKAGLDDKAVTFVKAG